MASSLSAVLIVHNEAARLGDCLDAVAEIATEIIVLDDASTDGTPEIARRYGAQVVRRQFDTFGAQKQAALELATCEWVLSLDADERVTPALAAEVRAVLDAPSAQGDTVHGYWIRRTLTYLGTPLRFGGTQSEWVLRLVRRDHARFVPRAVHEHLTVDGSTRRLRGVLEHVKYHTLSEHLATIDRYTEIIATEKRQAGTRFHWWHIGRVFTELFTRLILQRGVLDGRAGIIHATMAAFYGFLKYAKTWRATDT